MKFKITTALALALLCVACGGKAEMENDGGFVDDIVIKTTPVRNQGDSQLCWAYAMLATIESERLMKGDSLTLSPDYLARLWLQDQARTHYLTRGKDKVSLKGMISLTPRLMDRYGIEPYDNYHPFGETNWEVLCRTAEEVAHASTSLAMLDCQMDAILDQRVGFLPPSLFVQGMAYTPMQLAESICLPDDYAFMTSFSHHPFGEDVVLETPDNHLLDTFHNIPIDSLMDTIVKALNAGHPVCWEGDISESGFDFDNGIASLANDEAPVTQERRQHAFERFETTDDHCMELCGMAHDKHGRRFFIAKNSWGSSNRYNGFMYLSYNYVKMKTIAIAVAR